jgi:hypothetical protein
MISLINFLGIFYHICIYSCSINMMLQDEYYIMMGGYAIFTFVTYQLAVTYHENTTNNSDQ